MALGGQLWFGVPGLEEQTLLAWEMGAGSSGEAEGWSCRSDSHLCWLGQYLLSKEARGYA